MNTRDVEQTLGALFEIARERRRTVAIYRDATVRKALGGKAVKAEIEGQQAARAAAYDLDAAGILRRAEAFLKSTEDGELRLATHRLALVLDDLLRGVDASAAHADSDYINRFGREKFLEQRRAEKERIKGQIADILHTAAT